MENCEKFIDMISRKIDGDLSASETFELQNHLEICPSCASVQSAFEAISTDLSAQLAVPEGLSKKIMSNISKPKKIIPFKVISLGGLAASIAIIMALHLPNMGNEESQVTATYGHTSDAPMEIMEEGGASGGEIALYAAAPEEKAGMDRSVDGMMQDDAAMVIEETEAETDKAAVTVNEMQEIAPAAVPAEEGDDSLYVDNFLTTAKDILELKIFIASKNETQNITDAETIKLVLTSLSYIGKGNLPPDTAPDYSVEVPDRGVVDIWVDSDGLICSLDGVIFTPVTTRAELEEIIMGI